VENSIRFPGLEVGSDGGTALVGCDVALECDTAGNGLYGCKIDSDDKGIGGHNLCGDLTP
jgi:hypothetical protein